MHFRAVIFVLFALFAPGAGAQPAALVSVDAVARQAFLQTTPVVGKLVARRAGDVAVRIAGTVAEVDVRVGERVLRGQVLARLDTRTLELQLALVRARRDSAAAELQLAAQESKRLSALAESDAVSQATHDDALQRRRIAAAKLAAAEAEVMLAETDLADAEIKAPFAAAVTARYAEVGGYLQIGDAVVQLVSADDLEVEAEVFAEQLGGVEAGAVAEVLLDNGSRHRAVARAVVPLEEPLTRTRTVRFSVAFGGDAGLLAAEQSVTLLAPAGAQREFLSVHKDAIVRRATGAVVFVVADGVAEIRAVQTGVASGERIEVLSGLAEGELAVVRGNERLQPGQAVRAAQ